VRRFAAERQVDALAGAEKFDGEDVAQIVEHAFEAAAPLIPS